MRKINIFMLSLVAVLGIAPMGTAYALSDCAGMSQCTAGATVIQPTNCKTMSVGVLYGNYCLRTCNACESGYTKVLRTENLTGCSKTYYDCEKDFTTTTCTATTYSSSTCGTTPAYTLSNCSSVTKKCFGGAYVQTCNTCASGYTRTSKTYTPFGCSNAYTYYYCKSDIGGGDLVKACFSDADCTEGVGTTTIAGGTKTVTGDCVDANCEYTTSVSCDANYYRLSLSCRSCPILGGVAGVSAAGSTSIKSCYIPANTNIEDTLGTFKFTSDCYYSNSLILLKKPFV